MAKLSLWLFTLARDLPFTFLDHSFRHGDSLVGLDLEQIRAFHWKPEKQLSFLEVEIKRALDDAGIEITGLAGTSIGGVAAIAYAAGRLDTLEELALASGPLERPVAMFVDRSNAPLTRAAIENAPGLGDGNGPLGHQAVRRLEA